MVPNSGKTPSFSVGSTFKLTLSPINAAVAVTKYEMTNKDPYEVFCSVAMGETIKQGDRIYYKSRTYAVSVAPRVADARPTTAHAMMLVEKLNYEPSS